MPRGLRLGAGIASGVCLLLAAGAVSAGQTGGGTNDAPTAQASSKAYTVYWGVTRRGSGDATDKTIDMDGAPISTDFIVLYTSQLGRYPKAGPHVLLSDPDYMQAHLDKVARDVQRWIPEGFTGPVAIDYEPWPLLAPSRGSRESKYLDELERTILRDQPQLLSSAKSPTDRDRILSDEYEQLARDFYTQTIRLCKELRPEATWGFYGYPEKRYISGYTPAGTIGYGDHNNEASRMNDRLSWLVEESDALFPSIYALRETVDLPRQQRNPSFQNTAESDQTYVMSNVAEAVRMANGKPVLPFAGVRYQNNNPRLRSVLLNDANMRSQLVLPKAAGARGVIIWGNIKNDTEARQFQSYVENVIGRFAREASPNGIPREALKPVGRADSNDNAKPAEVQPIRRDSIQYKQNSLRVPS